MHLLDISSNNAIRTIFSRNSFFANRHLQISQPGLNLERKMGSEISQPARPRLAREHNSSNQAPTLSPHAVHSQSPVPLPASYLNALKRSRMKDKSQPNLFLSAPSSSPNATMPSAALKTHKETSPSPSNVVTPTTDKTGAKVAGSGASKKKKKKKKKKDMHRQKRCRKVKETTESEERKESQEPRESTPVPETVVKLEGPENIDKWHASLMAALGSLEHVVTQQGDSPVKPPAEDPAGRREWKANRKAAKKILKPSLTKVRHMIKGRIAKSSRKTQDPATCYRAVMRVMRAEADRRRLTSMLIKQACGINVTGFDSLNAYRDHLQELRYKMMLLDAYPGDRFMAIAAVNGLGCDSLVEGMLQLLIVPPNKGKDGVDDPSAMDSIPE